MAEIVRPCEEILHNSFESLTTDNFLNSALLCSPPWSSLPLSLSFLCSTGHHHLMFAQQLPGFAFPTAAKLQASVTWAPL